jgi:type I restriction enzyme S subunit
MSDELIELPEGWAKISFGDVCKVQGGYAFKSQDYQDNGLLLVRISNLINGTVQVSSNSVFLPEEYWEKFSEFQLNEGDVLIALSGATTGKMAVNNLPVPALLNQRVGRFKVIDSLTVDGGHVAKLVESITEQVLQRAYGGAQPNISPKEIEEFPILLPPLNEQKRIVAKIEELRDRLHRSKQSLEAVPELCDRFRQSVLAAAFRGDLTADWREENPDVEPASVLLERIRSDRHSLWRNELAIKGKDCSKVKYSEPREPSISSCNNLPDTWEWVSLDQLLYSLRNGLSRKPVDELPGIPILRISAVRAMGVNIDDIRFYRPDISEDVDSYLIESGDILFTRYNGNQQFVGVCGLVPERVENLLYPDKLIRGRLVNKNLCLPKFLEIICNVGVSRSYIEQHIKTSAGQHGIAGSDLKSTPIPLPPVAEQKAIVEIVDSQFSILKRLISVSGFCSENIQYLNQSILAKAFRGELVEQDPNDEPASVLLDRIRAEREASQENKKSRSARGKRKKAIDDQLDLLEME